jgi:hypothetical protein
VVIVSRFSSPVTPEAMSSPHDPSAERRCRKRSMSAGRLGVASTTAFALSTPSGTENSTNWLVTPSTRTPAPGASVVTEASNGA